MSVSVFSKAFFQGGFLKGVVAVCFVVALNLTTVPMAFAQSLNELRSTGKIGEAFDGFARARDGSVSGTVADINAKRLTIYRERAQEQGTNPDQVGGIYARKIIAKSPSGTWLLGKDGRWQQK